MVRVEQWAEIRWMHFAAGVFDQGSRGAGRDRNTVRPALRSHEPPRYARRPWKPHQFREEIQRLLPEAARDRSYLNTAEGMTLISTHDQRYTAQTYGDAIELLREDADCVRSRRGLTAC